MKRIIIFLFATLLLVSCGTTAYVPYGVGVGCKPVSMVEKLQTKIEREKEYMNVMLALSTNDTTTLTNREKEAYERAMLAKEAHMAEIAIRQEEFLAERAKQKKQEEEHELFVRYMKKQLGE